MILNLHATPEEVMRAVETLQEFGRQQKIPERTIFGLALALEECGSNVVNHALKRDPQKTFQVTLDFTEGNLVIELRDRGPEFDPTRAPVVEKSLDDDRPPGGWGIQLVRHYTDEMVYRRENGENVLRLSKKLGIPDSTD